MSIPLATGVDAADAPMHTFNIANAALIALKRITFVAALFLALVSVLAPGCVPPPPPIPAIHRKVIEGSRISTDDVKWVEIGKTTRAEIESRFGKPSKEVPAVHFEAYWWTIQIAYTAWGDMDKHFAFMIHYDNGDIVQKFQILQLPKQGLTAAFAREWCGN